jgi:paraquat-inducible protein A
MLASMQFDPRLIWDPVDGAQGARDAGTQGATETQGTQGGSQQSQDLKHD